MLDDAAVLLLVPGRNPGTSSNVTSGMLKAVAEADEARAFDRGVDVEPPGKHCRLIGDDADGRPSSRAKPTTMFCA